MKQSLGMLFGVLLAGDAGAVLFVNTDDVLHNREVAPGGVYEDAGWQYQGKFGNFLGTMIGPNHFVTAAHVSSAPTTFVHSSFFNGTATDVVYTIDTTVNGGTGYWNIGTTDLRVYEVTGTFSDWAKLYSGSDEVGKDLLVMGRGTQRGTLVTVGGEDKGWRNGAVDNRVRWGTNTVDGIADGGSKGNLIAAGFNFVPTGDEAHLTVGDSGGAVFIEEGGEWKLAGINYAVDGNWDTNDTTGDGTHFRAALFDAGGLWVGSDADGWEFVAEEDDDQPSSFYATRISDHRDALNAITGVPEPSSVLLLGVGGVCAFMRRRR